MLVLFNAKNDFKNLEDTEGSFSRMPLSESQPTSFKGISDGDAAVQFIFSTCSSIPTPVI